MVPPADENRDSIVGAWFEVHVPLSGPSSSWVTHWELSANLVWTQFGETRRSPCNSGELQVRRHGGHEVATEELGRVFIHEATAKHKKNEDSCKGGGGLGTVELAFPLSRIAMRGGQTAIESNSGMIGGGLASPPCACAAWRTGGLGNDKGGSPGEARRMKQRQEAGEVKSRYSDAIDLGDSEDWNKGGWEYSVGEAGSRLKEGRGREGPRETRPKQRDAWMGSVQELPSLQTRPCEFPDTTYGDARVHSQRMPLVVLIEGPEGGGQEKKSGGSGVWLGSRFKSVIPDLRAGRSGASLCFVIAAIPLELIRRNSHAARQTEGGGSRPHTPLDPKQEWLALT
ncbi:hypothetical protein NMY22_g4199 [Coprinellus aureogranulatus]|nr:hypothetical protein NMY22_g4199 [Coprinellus aureogranulatus]